MSVHDALVLINRAITDYLSPESGNFDADTQFCASWFEQYGWKSGPFGEAGHHDHRGDHAHPGNAEAQRTSQEPEK